FDRAPTRADKQIDVRHLVAVADQRLTDHDFIDLCHANSPPRHNLGAKTQSWCPWMPLTSGRPMDSYPCWQRPENRTGWLDSRESPASAAEIQTSTRRLRKVSPQIVD